MQPSDRMVHLTTVMGSFHGHVLAARLGSDGIPVELRGMSDGPYPLPSNVEVYVHEDQLELARALLLGDAVDAAFDERYSDLGEEDAGALDLPPMDLPRCQAVARGATRFSCWRWSGSFSSSGSSPRFTEGAFAGAGELRPEITSGTAGGSRSALRQAGQAVDSLRQHLRSLAEREAHQGTPGRAICVEDLGRYRRDAVARDQLVAELEAVLVTERADVNRREVGAGRAHDLESHLLQPVA